MRYSENKKKKPILYYNSWQGSLTGMFLFNGRGGKKDVIGNEEEGRRKWRWKSLGHS
jgi:hypothetical protein